MEGTSVHFDSENLVISPHDIPFQPELVTATGSGRYFFSLGKGKNVPINHLEKRQSQIDEAEGSPEEV